MKSSYAALGVVGLALAGLWYAGGGTTVPPQSADAAEQARVSAPLSHDNLTVFFIHGPDAIADAKIITLQEALEANVAVVHETGTVNTLAVENLSPDCELFIQEGDMIRGGKQDRMIAVDMLVSPKSGRIPLSVHCVESGRMRQRGNEAVTHFNKSDQFAVGNELRYANAKHEQGAVWENVKRDQEKLTANLGVKVNAADSETSLQLALENEALQAKVAEFEQALRSVGESRKNVIGVVFVVNGQMRGAEVYGSNALFMKAWPKLLRSAAADAVAEKTDRPAPPALSVGEVERYLALGGTSQPAANTGSYGSVNDLLPVAGRGPLGELDGAVFEPPLSDGRLPAGFRNVTQTPAIGSFSGRSGATRSQVLREGGAVAQGGLGGSGGIGGSAGVGTGAGLSSSNFLGGYYGNPYYQGILANPANAPGGFGSPLQQGVGANAASPDGHRQLVNVSLGVFGSSAPVTSASPDGNRLSVNRVENRSELVTESRDPARQNAVIHQSVIKLSGGMPKNPAGSVMRGW